MSSSTSRFEKLDPDNREALYYLHRAQSKALGSFDRYWDAYLARRNQGVGPWLEFRVKKKHLEAEHETRKQEEVLSDIGRRKGEEEEAVASMLREDFEKKKLERTMLEMENLALAKGS